MASFALQTHSERWPWQNWWVAASGDGTVQDCCPVTCERYDLGQVRFFSETNFPIRDIVSV